MRAARSCTIENAGIHRVIHNAVDAKWHDVKRMRPHNLENG